MRIATTTALLLMFAATTSAQNLVTNPGYETGDLSGWTVILNGGNGWRIYGSGHSGDYHLKGSYNWSRKSQEIDLIAKGISADLLDAAPPISVWEWYEGASPSYGDYYYLHVELRDSLHAPIATWDYGTLSAPVGADRNWRSGSNIFSDYGSGVRYVYMESGADDKEFWAGNYGTRIDDASVEVSAIPSTFDTGVDGWTTANDAKDFQWISSGGVTGGFIQATDVASGGIWYFVAPAKFHGDRRGSYGRALSFDLKESGTGTISGNDVKLTGNGVTLYYNTAIPGTGWTHYSLLLNESAGWKDQATNAAPSRDTFLSVLENLSALHIRGEYISGSDVGGLDNVILSTANRPPLALYDVAEAAEDTTGIVINPLVNDSDPNGDDFVVTHVADPAHGTVGIAPDGTTITYTPDADYFGSEYFWYTIRDWGGAETRSWVTMTVNGSDDPPGPFEKLDPPPDEVVGRGPVTLSWTSSVEPDGDPLTYTLSLQIAEIDTAITLTDTSYVFDLGVLGVSGASATGVWSVSASDGITSVSAGDPRGFVVVPTIIGDASGNGSVDAFDASLVLRNVVGLDALSDSGVVAADVTGNGEVSAWDASFILSYVVGQIAEFPGALARPAELTTLFTWGALVDRGDGTWELPLVVNGGSHVEALELRITLADGQGAITPVAGDAAGGWSLVSNVWEGVLIVAMASSQPLEDGEAVILVIESTAAADLIRDATLLRINESPLIPVGVIHTGVGTPPRFALMQNAPNPFNPSTDISFILATDGRVTLEIWSATGQMVRRLVDDYRRVGEHTVTWDATDDMGRPVASGVYLYRIVSAEHMAIRRAVLTR